MHVVATAGHVDHGKSTLVLALTGIDPDRWAEEKARGLTIDLGFANTTLPSGREVAFVDVPGHVRFIANMLAGVGAVDAALLVVAATEGWKPQSEEHLRILDTLGISAGVVAVTKVALVDSARRAEVRGLVEEHLIGTTLEGAPIVEVDTPTGEGLDDLRAELDALLAATPTSADVGRPRLWVDRSFPIRGAGTVVTGTLAGGKLRLGDALEVVGPGASGGASGGRSGRVRGLQAHGRNEESIGPGHRVAANLAGVDWREIVRGDALVRPGHWAPTKTLDASLRVLPGLDHPVSRRGAFAMYAGSGEHAVRVRVLGGSGEIQPGETGAVRLYLPTALPLLPGDRYVLRDNGRSETVGGGEVLDVAPVLPASRAAPSRSVERVVAERGWVDAGHLARLTGVEVKPNVAGWVVDPTVLAAAREKLLADLAAAGSSGLDTAGIDEKTKALLGVLPGVSVEGGRAWMAAPPGETGGSEAARARLASHPWLAALEAAPWSPPGADGVDRRDVRDMVRAGLVVEREGVYFAQSAVDQAAARLAALLAENPEGVTVAQFRDALGTTRKHAVPLLSILDATGVTRRRGDLRVAGPRMPAGRAPEA